MSDGVALPPEEQRELLVNEIRECSRILDEEGWSRVNSRGGTSPHWALIARRAAMETLRKLDKQNPPEQSDELAAWLEQLEQPAAPGE